MQASVQRSIDAAMQVIANHGRPYAGDITAMIQRYKELYRKMKNYQHYGGLNEYIQANGNPDYNSPAYNQLVADFTEFGELYHVLSPDAVDLYVTQAKAQQKNIEEHDARKATSGGVLGVIGERIYDETVGSIEHAVTQLVNDPREILNSIRDAVVATADDAVTVLQKGADIVAHPQQIADAVVWLNDHKTDIIEHPTETLQDCIGVIDRITQNFPPIVPGFEQLLAMKQSLELTAMADRARDKLKDTVGDNLDEYHKDPLKYFASLPDKIKDEFVDHFGSPEEAAHRLGQLVQLEDDITGGDIVTVPSYGTIVNTKELAKTEPWIAAYNVYKDYIKPAIQLTDQALNVERYMQELDLNIGDLDMEGEIDTGDTGEIPDIEIPDESTTPATALPEVSNTDDTTMLELDIPDESADINMDVDDFDLDLDI
jgi:hypothetical protein